MPTRTRTKSSAARWSDPVEIDRDSYFFVTNASLGGRSVTVEVWRLDNGAWRPKEFTVQPGDIHRPNRHPARASPSPST